MLFKLALWASLVFPDHGSQLQLSMALIVNVLQITVHVYLKPYGREDAAIMNLMHGAGIVLTLYINFSEFSMNYLLTSKELAIALDPLQDVRAYDRKISMVGRTIEVLTFMFIASFVLAYSKRGVMKTKRLGDKVKGNGKTTR